MLISEGERERERTLLPEADFSSVGSLNITQDSKIYFHSQILSPSFCIIFCRHPPLTVKSFISFFQPSLSLCLSLLFFFSLSLLLLSLSSLPKFLLLLLKHHLIHSLSLSFSLLHIFNIYTSNFGTDNFSSSNSLLQVRKEE